MKINVEKHIDLPPIRYTKKEDPFFDVLQSRVQNYFSSNNTSRYATPGMVGKSIFQLLLWIGLYSLIISNWFEGWSLIFLQIGFHFTMFLMAVGIAHDGSHNAYSRKKQVNRLMTRVFDIIGINSYLWDFNHIRSHHNAPNVPLYDSAIDSFQLFRFHPRARWSRMHRYQHLYIFGIYALATLFKLLFLDFFSMLRDRIGFVRMKKHTYRKVIWLISTKVFVIGYTLILPIMLLDAPWWQIILGFLLGHFVSGIALGIIFQVTHLSDHSKWPEPDADGLINNTFARHILATTADFSTQNRIITWISGGLNIHVAHHLFPGICHIHLPALAQIVRETADEFAIPYKEYLSVTAAIRSHLKTLKRLGTGDCYLDQGKVKTKEEAEVRVKAGLHFQ